MHEVFAALARCCEEQGSTLEASLVEDSATVLVSVLEVAASRHKLFGRTHELHGLGFAIRVQPPGGDDAAYLTLVSPDQWRSGPSGEPPWLELPSLGMTDTWSTSDVMAAVEDSGTGLRVKLRYEKQQWRASLEAETGRSCWVGVSVRTFESWLQSRTWRQVVGELFGRPAGLVLIYTWAGPTLRLGEHLSIGSLDVREGAPADPLWPASVERPIVRAAHVELAALEDGGWQNALAGVSAASAAACLLAAGTGSAAATTEVPIVWHIPDHPVSTPSGVGAVLALVRWTAREPTHTRLRVAQFIAYERVRNPLDCAMVDAMSDAAEIAYQLAVHREVRDSLSRQADLEQTFLQVDSDIAVLREKLRETIESTVTRVLTAGVAIAVAVLTTPEVRGWPAVVAGGGVLAYLSYELTFGLAMVKQSAVSRLDALDALAAQRDLGLGEKLRGEISMWGNDFKQRVRMMRIILGAIIIAAVVVAGVAILARELFDGDAPSPRSTTTPNAYV